MEKDEKKSIRQIHKIYLIFIGFSILVFAVYLMNLEPEKEFKSVYNVLGLFMLSIGAFYFGKGSSSYLSDIMKNLLHPVHEKKSDKNESVEIKKEEKTGNMKEVNNKENNKKENKRKRIDLRKYIKKKYLVF